MSEQAGPSGTMRDSVNPALSRVEEESERNDHVEEGVIEEEEDLDEDEEEEKGEEEEILDEHEPDVTMKVRQKDGTIVTFTIKEMSKGSMTSWMKTWSRRLRETRNGKKETNKSFDDFLLTMIGLCVYGPDGKLVERRRAAEWGHRLKFWTFNKCQEVNGLTDKVVQKEGKD